MTDEQGGYPGAPPGWYPDPAGGPGQRWWDGYAWNEAVIAPTAPPAAPPWAEASARLASAGRSGSVATEVSMVAIGRVAMAYRGVSFLLVLLFIRVNATQFRFLGHQVHLAYIAAQHNLPAPTLQTPTFNSATSAILSLNWLLSLGALVISLIWQHRAASAARSLGLPARHSPAWGVGSHFVPIVSLWFPYQAIVDCFEPGDARRGLVLRYWISLIGAEILVPAAVVAAFFNSGLSLVFSVPGALLGLAVLALGPGVVTTIAAGHRALLEGANRQAPVGV
jgi:hypothetical protein